MRLGCISAQALLVLSFVVPSAVSAPADVDAFGRRDGADVYLYDLVGRDTADEANETSVTSTTTSASGAATLAPQDDLSKATAKPPDFDDFKDFFTNKDNNIKRHMLVFWSGTGIDDPQTFAGRQDRFTLEMIVGTKWKQYQTDKAHGGYWKTWYDCVDGFWTPASDALSSVATGDVAVILSADADYLQQQEDPTHATCPTCWYNTEKPNLIHNLLKGSVAGIFKYHTPLPAKYIGKITSMGDKL